MVAPRIVPRAEHPISRRDVDPDALKVLYRLRQFNHIAYLVGGSVRDLLLGRRPKDFDVGTSAHPYQVKKLFRNCWIIGRRFRLAHVKFQQKVIEVATFRQHVPPGAPEGPGGDSPDQLIRRDNTFGTPEEDAFRRDFTINALFYDIATFSIIDYVGGLEDIRARIVRSIGDPDVRFVEDPVRMMRAVALSARLDFAIDSPVLEAIRTHRHELARCSAPRLLEEYYKILRSGASEKAFRGLAAMGLLEPVSPELHRGAGDALWRSLARLDEYRARLESAPDALTNSILLGTLLMPLGLASRREGSPLPESAVIGPEAVTLGAGGTALRHEAPPRLGELPLARRDVERFRQVLALQRRLHALDASPRAKRALLHRSVFPEALAWFEIHGCAPEAAAHWKQLAAEAATAQATATSPAAVSPDVGEPAASQRRRRRRRRRHQFRATETPDVKRET
jgi:poly(A) polymerase